MNIITKDMWRLLTDTRYGRTPCGVVIPINIGWKKTGENVMGRGIARQAANIYGPNLAYLVGQECQKTRGETTTFAIRTTDTLYMFPTKPFNASAPWLSWKQPSNLELVRKSAKALRQIALPNSRVFVPLVGCGNGQLDPADVYAVLEDELGDDKRFELVLLPTYDKSRLRIEEYNAAKQARKQVELAKAANHNPILDALLDD